MSSRCSSSASRAPTRSTSRGRSRAPPCATTARFAMRYKLKAVPYTLVLAADGHAVDAFEGAQDEATLARCARGRALARRLWGSSRVRPDPSPPAPRPRGTSGRRSTYRRLRSRCASCPARASLAFLNADANFDPRAVAGAILRRTRRPDVLGDDAGQRIIEEPRVDLAPRVVTERAQRRGTRRGSPPSTCWATSNGATDWKNSSAPPSLASKPIHDSVPFGGRG